MGIERKEAPAFRSEFLNTVKAKAEEGKMEELKAYVQAAIEDKKKIRDVENILTLESLEVIELVLPAIVESGIDRKSKQLLALAAMQNPIIEVADYAAGEMAKTGLHVGLIGTFDADPSFLNRDLIKAQARTIALTSPTLPKKVLDYMATKEGASDYILTNILIKNARKDLDIDIHLDGSGIRRSIDSDQKEGLIKMHGNAVDLLRENAINKAMAESNIPEEHREKILKRLAEADVSVKEFRQNKVRAMEKLIGYESTLDAKDQLSDEAFLSVNTIAFVLHTDIKSVDEIREHKIMKKLLDVSDKTYYIAYADAYSDDSLTDAQRGKLLRKILTEAISSEALEGRLDLGRYMLTETKDRVTSSITDVATNLPQSVQNVAKVATVVTAAKAIEVLTVDDSKEAGAIAPVTNTISQKMKSAIIANNASKKELSNGDVQVTIENHPVIFSVKNNELVASVSSSRDNKSFTLPELTMAALEKVVAIDVIQYDMRQSIWKDDYNDAQLLKYVFNINPDDKQMADMTQYKDQLSAMPFSGEKVKELYKKLGVINPDLSINRKRAIRTGTLFTYLEAVMGLDLVEIDDLEALAEVWKATGKADLMTPDTAKERIRNIA
ncbi:MAG: hypothetical protein HOG89_00735 [Candidatus Peribacter sp.]|jgi:hypothetical protein|nr:hypothetical protein [Candidatus Peribacter sp.]MBT4392950.1 hypothetical protein [Candidatus Peribacter sp.]MBT4601010.1 hypothetical protein [Candidatus Peribacter sp.]MBT5149052.1 hypothetical protein [Candidatus Peribacter sp.]MBT5637376.1 hypothetical protein [Candidatus Peribacter sp.]